MVGEEKIHAELASGKTDAEKVAAAILADGQLLASVFRGTTSKLPRVKFGCSKALMLLSAKQPELLYPEIDNVVGLLDSDNQILKWNAIAILGNLAAADHERRVPGVTRMLLSYLSCGELITVNNAIAALGKIGRAHPGEQAEIASRLIAVEKCSFNTAECRNIAVGKALLALDMFLEHGGASMEAIEFARRQTGNRRAATAKKAKALLRKLSPQHSKKRPMECASLLAP